MIYFLGRFSSEIAPALLALLGGIALLVDVIAIRPRRRAKERKQKARAAADEKGTSAVLTPEEADAFLRQHSTAGIWRDAIKRAAEQDDEPRAQQAR